MDIKIIKWMIGYAEGFSLKSEDIEKGEFSINIPIPFTFLESWCNHFRTDIWKHIYYPLLLQRAIEGVNSSYFRDHDRYSLKSRYSYDQEKWCYMIIRLQGEGSQTDWYETIDQAKEQALKYIWEQED